MKKRLILLSLIVIIFCISGCGKAESKTPDSSKVSTNESKNKDSDKKESQKEEKSEIELEKNKSTEPEPWTPIPIDQTPADYNCEFCLGCGKTNSEVTITKWGYCYSCFDKFRPFGSCAVCGVALDGSDTAHYVFMSEVNSS